jgi:photosystem II stability/assembly factor-like uncharacterized protein
VRKAWIVLLAAFCGGAFFGASPSAEAVPAWTEIGPAGGLILGLAQSAKIPNVYYAVSQAETSQVFKSKDGGKTWCRIGSFDDYLQDVGLDPRNAAVIYALGGENFYSSVDGGASFKTYRYPKDVDAYEGLLAVHPTNPGVLFAAGEAKVGQGGERLAVLRSRNGGRTWTATKIGPAGDWASPGGIALSPQDPNTGYFCGYIYLNGYEGRVFKTVNGGATWTDVTSAPIRDAPYIHAVVVDPKDKNRVYLATSDGVARSADGGASWLFQEEPERIGFGSIAVDPASSNILYAQTTAWWTDRGCYKSSNGGRTWKKFASGVYGSGLRILVSKNRVWLATTAGLFRSDNRGVSYVPSQTGLNASRVRKFALAPSAPATIYAHSLSYACFRTKTGGSGWKKCAELPVTLTISGLEVHPSNPKTVYVLADRSNEEDDLFKSVNSGTSFKSVLKKEIAGIAIDPADGNRLAAAGAVYASDPGTDPSYFGIYLTTNGGGSWTPVKIRNDERSKAEVVAFAPSDRKTIYVGGTSAAGQTVLHKSVDGGTSWRELSGPFKYGFYAIAVDPDKPTTVYVGYPTGFCKSVNGGASWTSLTQYQSAYSIVINPRHPNEVFFGSMDGVFYSDTGGADWTDLNEGLPVLYVNWIGLDPAGRKLFAGTEGGGICRRRF